MQFKGTLCYELVCLLINNFNGLRTMLVFSLGQS